MKTRLLICWLCFVLIASLGANAQLSGKECPYSNHTRDLICLIPEATQTGNSPLTSFNATIGQVLGELPLAVPNSGFVFGFKGGIPTDLTENLGSVLTERGNTVGKGKLFLGFTFQRFVFSKVDGNSLSDLPFFSVSPTDGVAHYSVDSIHANIDQYTTFAAYGIGDRIDVSVSLPFQRVSLTGGRSNNLDWSSSGAFLGSQAPFSAPGSASGFGDLILSAKASVLPGEGKSRLAAGFETRFPTGNVYNLLGTGALGFKPYVVFSSLLGRFTPHANVGYQWNGFSPLRLSQEGAYLRLPGTIDYSAGTDIGLVRRRLSMVADLVGQRYLKAPQVVAPVPVSSIQANQALSCQGTTPSCFGTSAAPLTTIQVRNTSYNVDNLSLGLKLSPAKHLIISANALIRLDSAGLRPDRFVPLAGISYVFGK